MVSRGSRGSLSSPSEVRVYRRSDAYVRWQAKLALILPTALLGLIALIAVAILSRSQPISELNSDFDYENPLVHWKSDEKLK